MPIELGLFGPLLNGNYLLYGPLAWGAHAIAVLFGYRGLAVESLRVLDSALGACGLAFFFLTLRRLGAVRGAAACWTAVLGASLGYWRWSAEAEAYMLSTFLLTLNLYFLSRRLAGEAVGASRLGLFHGLAVLGHVVNAVFVPAALFAVLRSGRRRTRDAVEFLGASAAVVVASYAAALALAVRPESPAEAAKWLLGSASPMEGGFRWHGSLSWEGLLSWARMTVNILTSLQPAFSDPPAWPLSGACLWAARALLLAAAAALVARWGRLDVPRRGAAGLCLLWLAGYAAVFTSWEPYTMVYRVSDLVPIIVLLQIGAGTLRGRGPSAAQALLPALLFLGNLGAEIRPRSFISNNPHLGRMTYIRSQTRETDWVAGEGGRDELYLPYFAQRRPLLIGRYHDALPELSRRIDETLSRGERVFVASPLMGDPFWGPYFRRFRPSPVAAGPGGYALFMLKSSSALRQVRSATSSGETP